jgi:hypothetical protein
MQYIITQTANDIIGLYFTAYVFLLEGELVQFSDLDFVNHDFNQYLTSAGELGV